MEVKNLSRTKMAEMINIGPTNVSKWTSMEQEFPLKHIVKLCEHFPDLNIRWFLTGVGPMLIKEQNQNPIAQEPTSPYITECTNPICVEKIKSLNEMINELRADKKFLQEQLQRKVEPPENKVAGGVGKPYSKTG